MSETIFVFFSIKFKYSHPSTDKCISRIPILPATDNNIHIIVYPLILKNPVTKAVKCLGGKEEKERRVLTISEQKDFLEIAKTHENYNQYAFALQTGLRVGELIGLKWSDIDYEKKILYVRRTMTYRHPGGIWQEGEPKSKAGNRVVPLTGEAVAILKAQKEKMKKQKVVPIEFSDYVFLSKKGRPITNASYRKSITCLCKKAQIPRFSMHTLV